MSFVGSRWADVGVAWSHQSVRRGFYGTFLIALGSLTPAYLPRNSPWLRLLGALHATGTPFKVLGTVLVLAGMAILVDAWFRMRPSDIPSQVGSMVYHDVRHWAVLVIWGAPFVFAPPIFSHDAYSYAAQGWLIHNGINPYSAGPGILPGAFADQVAWVWRFTPAPYGPLSLQIQHGLVDLMGHDPYLSALAMRLPAVLGVGLIGLLIPRIARKLGTDAAFAAWFATLNPLLVIDFVGGAHNDALMMGLVVLAIWLALQHRWGWLPAAVVVGVAAAIKQPAFLAAYAVPLIGRPWESWHWREVARTVLRVLVSFALAIATFAGLSVVTRLGFGWYNAVGVPGMVITVSPFTLLGQALQWMLDIWNLDPTGHNAIRYSRTLGLTIAGIVLTWLALTVARRRPVTFLSLGYLAVALAGPALHSWYVLWGGLLLPLTRPSERVVRAAVWSTVILLSYSAINLSWRNGLVALGVAALAGYLWQVRIHDLSEARAAQDVVPVD